jgi:hypothetical protein
LSGLMASGVMVRAIRTSQRSFVAPQSRVGYHEPVSPQGCAREVPSCAYRPLVMKSHALVGVGMPTTVVIVLTQAPLWMAAVLIPALVLCVLVATVFPQDSADRLEWWHDYRHAPARRRSRRRRAEPIPQQRQRGPK